MSVESKIPNSVALRHLDATPAAVTDSAASQQELQLGGQPVSKEKALRLVGPFATDKMGTKMKGLLKGLRYISQIFEPNCKEHEMEIGYPTDVKHVAHIGWDGASVNTPSWMKKFGSASDLPSSPFTLPGAENESTGAVSSLQGLRCTTADVQDKASRGTPGTPKQSRRHQSSGNAATADPSKPTRRHLSNGEPSDAPAAEPSEATKPSRRRLTVGSNEADSPTRDSPKVPKNPRHRRPKGDGSTRSSSRASKLKAASSASTEDDSAKPSEENQLT
ncbi:CRIB domain-containing protein RIC7-like [Nymphaea colorata]|nr:CRIB domain-containing protein RIC7-like [Nymphaea colorata]